MENSVLITLIVVGGALLGIVAWKVLDIGRRPVELEGEHPGRRHDRDADERPGA